MLLLIILTLPITVPIFTTIIQYIFDNGVVIGTEIRKIMEGFSC